MDDKKEKEIQEQKRFSDKIASNGAIQSTLLIPVKNFPLAPLIAGVSFYNSEEKTSLFRLRRFAYSETYIKKFLIYNKEDQVYSNLSGKWMSSNDLETIQSHLNDEFGLTFNVLEPLFVGNQRYRDIKKRGKSYLFNAELVVVDEKNVTIACEKILDQVILNNKYDITTKTETIEVGILGKIEKNFRFFLYEIKINDKVSILNGSYRVK